MKIANILRRFSFEEWGGTETAVWNTSKTLAAMGHSVEIMSTSALSATARETVDSIEIKRFPYFYPHLFLSNGNAAVLDKKGGNPFSAGIYRELLRGDFDIIHTHAMGRLAKEAIKAAHAKGLPSVVSLHGGHYDVPKSEFKEMATPLKGAPGYGGILERALGLHFDIFEQADGIVCVGENEYDEIKKRFPGKPAAFIPNGVDCDKFSKTPEADFRAAYAIPRDGRLILCVSRIDCQKNQKALVRLVKNLTDGGENVHCAMVGFVTSKSYLEEIEREIQNTEMRGRITIVEGLPPDSDMLVSAYKSADIFALPSVHEPFGIVALEAWSAGLPVMASNVGGLGRLVKEGETGCLFDPFSDAQIADAYRRATANAKALTTNAEAEARGKYSWRAVSESLLNFYGRVKNHA